MRQLIPSRHRKGRPTMTDVVTPVTEAKSAANRRPEPADAHPHRHHRDRILRPGHGHRAAEAGRGLRHPGEGRRRRRHLAGQQLSRLRLRHPVAPVLVLVRAQAGLEEPVLLSARDLGLPQRRHRQVRAAPLHRVQLPGRPRALGRRRVPLARVHRRRARIRRPVPGLGGRRAAHSVLPRDRGSRRIRRCRFPFRASGTTASI